LKKKGEKKASNGGRHRQRVEGRLRGGAKPGKASSIMGVGKAIGLHKIRPEGKEEAF